MTLIFICLFQAVFSEELMHAIVYGNTEELGYYYTSIYVGSPPMRQTVIVDTGSHLTAFPCEGCQSCGTHMDDYFDYKASSTSREVSCDEGISCSTCQDNKCGYAQSYAEGSSLRGFLVEDLVSIGNTSDHSVRHIFGCHNRETNLFRTQKADGIMGLGYARSRVRSIIDVLYEKHEINTDLFGICFGKKDGYMSVGGYNSSLHNYPLEWVNMYDNNFYSIKATNILLNEQSLGLKESDFSHHYTSGTIVDSGTTFTYLASGVYDRLWSEFEDYCRGQKNCLGEQVSVPRETHKCYKFDSSQMSLEEFYQSFPVISFKIEDLFVDWVPEYYLFAWPDHPQSYCLGVYRNYRGNVLGGNFMRGMDVVIDRYAKKIGFAPSDCDPRLLPAEKTTTNYTHEIHLEETQPAHSVVWFVIGAVLLLVLLGILLYKKLSKGTNILREEVSEIESNSGI